MIKIIPQATIRQYPTVGRFATGHTAHRSITNRKFQDSTFVLSGRTFQAAPILSKKHRPAPSAYGSHHLRSHYPILLLAQHQLRHQRCRSNSKWARLARHLPLAQTQPPQKPYPTQQLQPLSLQLLPARVYQHMPWVTQQMDLAKPAKPAKHPQPTKQQVPWQKPLSLVKPSAIPAATANSRLTASIQTDSCQPVRITLRHVTLRHVKSGHQAPAPSLFTTVLAKISNLLAYPWHKFSEGKFSGGKLWHNLALYLLPCLWCCLLWPMFWQPAAGALAVIDARLLAESMRQRSLAVKQWAHDNDQQLQQINQLTKGNAQLLSTHDLMAQNYRMDHQSSWQNIETMREQSLALLYASKALWDEYGSAQQYYADSLKAQAWESCINTRVCDFNQALQDINELKLNQAIQAYQNATSMSYKIEDQIGALQQLPLEGLNSQSLAATIDVLAKINGSVAVSMADLNQQLAILTKITSQNMAKESQTETLNRAFLEAITSHQSVFQEPVTNQIPN